LCHNVDSATRCIIINKKRVEIEKKGSRQRAKKYQGIVNNIRIMNVGNEMNKVDKDF